MGQRDALDVGAGAAPVLPEFEQLGNLGHAETQGAGAAYEKQGVDLRLAILPVAGVGAVHGGQQAERFVAGPTGSGLNTVRLSILRLRIPFPFGML